MFTNQQAVPDPNEPIMYNSGIMLLKYQYTILPSYNLTIMMSNCLREGGDTNMEIQKFLDEKKLKATAITSTEHEIVINSDCDLEKNLELLGLKVIRKIDPVSVHQRKFLGIIFVYPKRGCEKKEGNLVPDLKSLEKYIVDNTKDQWVRVTPNKKSITIVGIGNDPAVSILSFLCSAKFEEISDDVCFRFKEMTREEKESLYKNGCGCRVIFGTLEQSFIDIYHILEGKGLFSKAVLCVGIVGTAFIPLFTLPSMRLDVCRALTTNGIGAYLDNGQDYFIKKKSKKKKKKKKQDPQSKKRSHEEMLSNVKNKRLNRLAKLTKKRKIESEKLKKIESKKV